jgi:hypothetical protein
MCEEKIHLFDKSREFGFRRAGPDGRRSRENDLFARTGFFLTALAYSRIVGAAHRVIGLRARAGQLRRPS